MILSDNLHISLTNKFIDASSRYFINNPLDENIEKVEIDKNNVIKLDGTKYGFIKGLNILL